MSFLEADESKPIVLASQDPSPPVWLTYTPLGGLPGACFLSPRTLQGTLKGHLQLCMNKPGIPRPLGLDRCTKAQGFPKTPPLPSQDHIQDRPSSGGEKVSKYPHTHRVSLPCHCLIPQSNARNRSPTDLPPPSPRQRPTVTSGSPGLFQGLGPSPGPEEASSKITLGLSGSKTNKPFSQQAVFSLFG